jgi:hypothetical protein
MHDRLSCQVEYPRKGLLESLRSGENMETCVVTRKLAGALIALIALIGFGLLSPSAYAGDLSDLRGKRYGEVLLGTGGLIMPKQVEVYNTIGLNDCPDALWSKLDPKKIKQDTGAKFVRLNGPRYWVIDGMKNSSLVSKDKKNFGGIDMREAGILQLSADVRQSAGKSYVIHKVARHTIWVYKAGQPVYQLIGPDKSVYFMQSFSVQKEQQTVDTLSSLGKRLNLPTGWQFRVLKLSKDFELPAEKGVAYVVQDNLSNTYQKSSAKVDDSF